MTLKNVVIGLAIMILTISVVVQGVALFYDSPEYSDFCSDARFPKIEGGAGEGVVCPAVCVELYEIQDGVCILNECGSGCGPDGISTFRELNQCEIALDGENCWDVYDSEREVYSRNIFLIALPLGIAIIAVGALVFGLEAVGAGLMAGGLGVVLWGVGSFWGFADDWLKFLLSLVGLVILIWLAFKMNNLNWKTGKIKKKRK